MDRACSSSIRFWKGSDMNIELDIPGNRNNPTILTFDTEIDQAFLGSRIFLDIGKFEYSWAIEYLDRSEIEAMIEALTFALNHMGTEPM